MSTRKAYPSDLKDPEWAVLEPLMPPVADRGRPRETSLREVVNGLLYLLRTGCAWGVRFKKWAAFSNQAY